MRFQVFFCPFGISPPPLSKLAGGAGYSPGTTPPAISHRISSPSGRLSSSCKALNTPPHRSYTLRYLKNTTVFYQNKFNKNLKSLKAQHGVQIISGQDCRKTPGLFSATPKSVEGRGGCGAILYPHPEKHRPFFRYPSHSLIQQPTPSPGHPRRPPGASQPQETETAASTAGIADRNTERTQKAAKPLQQQGKLLMAD